VSLSQKAEAAVAMMLAANTASEVQVALACIGELMDHSAQELELAVTKSKKGVMRRLDRVLQEDSEALDEEAFSVAEVLFEQASKDGTKPPNECATAMVISPSDAARLMLSSPSCSPQGQSLEPLHVCISVPNVRMRSDRKRSPIPLMFWPGASLLAEVLVSAPEHVAGKRVLEIGCGFHGIVTLAAARAGANYVLATDKDAEAVHRTLANLEQANAVGCNMHGSVLDLERIDECSAIAVSEMFDLVVGSEVIHETPMGPLLVDSLTRLLAPGGRAVVVNAAAHHRFGVPEFQACLRNSVELEAVVAPFPEAMLQKLEGLEMHDSCMSYELYSIHRKGVWQASL